MSKKREKREAVIDPDTGEILGYVKRSWDRHGNQHHTVVAETQLEAEHAREIWEASEEYKRISDAHHNQQDEDEVIRTWDGRILLPRTDDEIARSWETIDMAAKRLTGQPTTTVTVRFNKEGDAWVPDLVIGKEGQALDIVQGALDTDPDRMPLVRREEISDEVQREREAKHWHSRVADKTEQKSQAEAGLTRARTGVNQGRFAFVLGTGGLITVSFISTVLPLFASIVLTILAVSFMIGGGVTMVERGKETASQIKKRDNAQSGLDALYVNMPEL